jgi:NifU-like protein
VAVYSGIITIMHGNSGQLAELFFNPRNVGDATEPSFIGRSSSFTCGASLRISLHIDEAQRIAEAKFKAAGCSVLVASASFLLEQIIGKTTGEAAALGQDAGSINEQLDCMEAERRDCSALACEALIQAIRDYSDSVRDEWEGDEALICTCFCVSERTIESEIEAGGLRTIAEVTKACKAGAGCRSCYPLIEDILDDCWRTQLVNSK